MSNTQSNNSLRELNAKLLAKICELRKKIAEDEVEKTKLRQEFKARTDELEETISHYSVEIGKLNAIIIELEKNKTVTVKLESYPYVTKLSNSNDLEVSASPISPSNPTRNHVYFCNKILKQYPNLCQEGSDGNDNYYGITDKSLYPLCKLDHNDENGIEGRYEIESYNLKCEQCKIEIEITA
ncbi:16707_t:CDS:2 [Racocetra fulgida]|uniref:16707_t:CDS:1 n=1 Tax=Racocetra fulgida TaxID=60492 RepID=A0A9N8Z4X2_9GLOM|nr:16707_t:CDS:2 [Racocetra fulgida]